MSPQVVTEQMLQTDTANLVEPINQGDLQETPASETTEGVEKVTKPQVIQDSSQVTPKFKHKTWEETETARIEAVKKMTEATERASRYEKMVQNLTQQVKPTEQPESTAKRLAKEALASIKKLDPLDPNYEEKAAIIWAEAQEKIADTKFGERSQQEADYQSATSAAETKAKEAGLTSPLAIEAFWMVAKNAPKGIPFEQQVEWSIDQVKQFIEEVKNEALSKNEDTVMEKKNLKVLTTGGKRPSLSKETDVVENSSLADALKAVKNSRIVRS